MTDGEIAKQLLSRPDVIGHALGFTDLREDLHGGWIKKLTTASEDMTLLAHRGSYKTTCVIISIALRMLWHPECNIIFIRKTDTDVVEVIKAVQRALESEI